MDLTPSGRSRRRLLVLLGAMGAASSVPAQRGTKMAIEDEFRALSQLQGRPYLALRDALLARGAGQADLVARFRSDPDWRLATTGAILQGWTERRPFYTTLLAEVDRIDPAARSKRVSGLVGVWEEFEMRALHEFGPPVLPLAWEQIVKLAEDAPPWRTATWLAMIAGVPMAQSIEPVVHLVETTEDQMLRERAAMTLSRLPREAVDARLDRLSAKAVAVAATVRSARELRR